MYPPPSHRTLNETFKSILFLILATFVLVLSSCDGVMHDYTEEVTIQVYDNTPEEEIADGIAINPGFACIVFKAPENSQIEAELSFELEIDINGSIHTETLSAGQVVVINNIPAEKIYPVKCSAYLPTGGVYATGSINARMTPGEVSTLNLVMRRVGEDSNPLPTDVTVTFNSNGGNSVDPQTFASGGKATRPVDPIFDGYTFGGWFTTADGGIKFDFNSPLDNSITLFAKWITVPDGGFVFVEGGTYQMGDATISGATPHSVTVSDFFISDHEVTQSEYSSLCKYPSDPPSNSLGKGGSYPAYNVSWYDAIVYCNLRSIREGLTPCYKLEGETNSKIWPSVQESSGKYCGPSSSSTKWNEIELDIEANGYRLLTEAEWEYAARGGNKSHGYIYSGSDTLSDVGWLNSNYGSQSCHVIRQKQPNELGIYDMSGNLAEWCWDWKGDYSSEPQINPVGPSSGSARVFRGGSCYSGSNACTVTYRASIWGSDNDYGKGFRIARSVVD